MDLNTLGLLWIAARKRIHFAILSKDPLLALGLIEDLSDIVQDPELLTTDIHLSGVESIELGNRHKEAYAAVVRVLHNGVILEGVRLV